MARTADTDGPNRNPAPSTGAVSVWLQETFDDPGSRMFRVGAFDTAGVGPVLDTFALFARRHGKTEAIAVFDAAAAGWRLRPEFALPSLVDVVFGAFYIRGERK